MRALPCGPRAICARRETTSYCRAVVVVVLVAAVERHPSVEAFAIYFAQCLGGGYDDGREAACAISARTAEHREVLQGK